MNKIKIVLYLLFLFIFGIGISFAYFYIPVNQIDVKDIKVSTATLELAYTDGPEILYEKVFPGLEIQKQITVKNTGTDTVVYNIYWKELINEIENGDLIYSISCISYLNYNEPMQEINGACPTVDETPINNNKSIVNGVSIELNVTHVYQLNISFKETGSNQNANQGKKFYGIINVDSDDSVLMRVKNTLDSINDFSSASPYLGDVVKINNDFLSDYNIITEDEYLYNTKTEEIYSLNGELYNGTQYYSDKDYYFLSSPNDEAINKKNIIDLKYYFINRLKTSQIENGAFPTYTTTDTNVNPYFAETISLGLINDMSSLMNVKDYIIWHMQHVNMTSDIHGEVGTIYDYTIDRESLVETSKNDYDSQDSYAALLYIVLYEYYKKTGDTSIFTTYRPQIEKTIESLESVYNSTKNLTYAKESYQVFYLMDNAEVTQGYRCLSKIYEEIYNDPVLADYYMNKHELMKNSFNDNFYNQEQNMYDWAYGVSSLDTIDTNFYPNVTAQFYPIYYGIVDPSSDLAKHLYYLTTYYSTSNHYDWYNYDNIMISTPNTYYSNNILLCVALMMNSSITSDNVTINIKNEVKNAYENLYNIHINNNEQFLWYLGEDGNTLLSIDLFLKNITSGW